MSETSERSRVARTGDFFGPDGGPRSLDNGLSVLDEHDHIEWFKFPGGRPRIGAHQVAGARGVIVPTPAVTAGSVSQARDLLAIGRFDVG